MSLPHALLTSLQEKPSSGLELAHRFDHSIGYFWAASHQQIYRELARLEEAGWVMSTEEGGRGRRRRYRVLPAGCDELRRWVEEGAAPRPLRDELMVRLRAEAVVGPTALADGVRHRLDLHRQKLALFREIEARDFSGNDLTREQQLRHLVLTTGILSETMYIEVSERALGILEAPAR